MRAKPSAGFSCAWPSELHEKQSSNQSCRPRLAMPATVETATSKRAIRLMRRPPSNTMCFYGSCTISAAFPIASWRVGAINILLQHHPLLPRLWKSGAFLVAGRAPPERAGMSNLRRLRAPTVTQGFPVASSAPRKLSRNGVVGSEIGGRANCRQSGN
jgi:hypothetical protein